jgi:hypothetical protein
MCHLLLFLLSVIRRLHVHVSRGSNFCVASIRSSFDPLYSGVAPAPSFVVVCYHFPCCIKCVSSMHPAYFRLCWVGVFGCVRCSDVHLQTIFFCVRRVHFAPSFQKIGLSVWAFFLRLGSAANRVSRGYCRSFLAVLLFHGM